MAGPRFDVLSRGLTTLTYRGSHCMNSRLPDYLPRLRRVCCVSKILGGLRHAHTATSPLGNPNDVVLPEGIYTEIETNTHHGCFLFFQMFPYFRNTNVGRPFKSNDFHPIPMVDLETVHGNTVPFLSIFLIDYTHEFRSVQVMTPQPPWIQKEVGGCERGA